jgi:hypothetical protein
MVPKDPIKAEQYRASLCEAWKHRAPASEKTLKRMSETNKKRCSTPEWRAQQKERLSHPETRRRMSESAKNRCNPEWCKKMSEQKKELFKNPLQKEKLINGIKKKQSDTVWKEKRQAQYKDPGYRKKLCEIALLKKENFYEGNIGGFWYGNVKYYESKYCDKFNEEFKERVRAYRGYICFECGKPQNGKALHVHHVHYDKKMCCNGSPRDCVPLCKSCHGHTQKNRDYWEDHFTELIYAYDPTGKCFFTKEEMNEFVNHKEEK